MADRPIDAGLVHELVAEQFPAWRDLPVRPVAHDGWDNRTFRLGDTLSVRLPSAAGYVEQVAKEHAWLPRLAPHLPLPIPEPVAEGVPGAGYPYPWSVYRWLPGTPLALALAADAAAPIALAADAGTISPIALGAAEGTISPVDPVRLARDIGAFLVALRACDTTGAPPPGTHNFFRGAPPAVYGDEALAAIDLLGPDAPLARELWAEATASAWQGDPVWIHGDVAEGNLLVHDGRLCAVIDFGTSGIGDPACDLVPAWTLFDGEARTAFVDAVALDPATWSRARGWALWKTAITLRDRPTDPASRRTLHRLLTA